MNRLRAFEQEAGLSDEGLAVLLEQRTDRDIPLGRVQNWLSGKRPMPQYVLAALDELDGAGGVAAEHDGQTVLGEPQDDAYGPSPFREGDEPPAEPAAGERLSGARRPGSALAPVVPEFDVKTVREVLVTAYTMIGKGAQYAARPGDDGVKPDYVAVFDAHAERCADAWIDLAKRDAKVARVLTTLTAGGAWGQVILIHGSLVASLLVVSGKVRLPDGGVPMAPSPGRPIVVDDDASPHEPTPAV